MISDGLTESSSEWFNEPTQYIQEAIVTKDLNGVVRTWNPAAERLFDYRREDITGSPIGVLAPLDRKGEINFILDRIKSGRSIIDLETIRLRRDGTPIDVIINVSPIYGPDNSIVGAVKSARAPTYSKSTATKLGEFEAIFEACHHPIFYLTRDGVILKTNHAGLSMSAAGDLSVLGLPFWEPAWLLAEQNQSVQIRRAIQRAAKGEFAQLEGLMITRDEGEVLVDFSFSPIKDDEGAISRIVVVARNVTESRRIEHELRLENSILHKILDSLPIGVGLITSERAPMIANVMFKRLVPNSIPSADPKVGLLWQGFDDHGEVLTPDRYPGMRALRGERVWPGDNFLYRGDADRGPFWTRVAAVPFISEAGAKSALSIIIDRDEEKRALKALRESEERLEKLVMSTMDAIIAVDDQQKIIVFNPAAETLFGISKSDAFGTPIDRFIPAASREAHARHFAEFSASGVTGRRMGSLLVLKAQRASGEEFPIEASISQAGVAGSRVFTVIVRDVTERINFEEHLQVLVREVNHRSMNLLTVVQSLARMTNAHSIEDFRSRFSNRLLALAACSELLVKSEWRNINLTALVRAQLAYYEDLIAVGRIAIQGPEILISPTPAQSLGLALHELLTNAGKYGAISASKGRIIIEWTCSSDQFEMIWREEGGPVVAAPTRQGYGTTVLKQIMVQAFAGSVDIDYKPEGVTWRLRCPMSQLTPL